VNGKKIKQ